MAERVRICDIAEELGLSTATVSNVIHGKTGKVSAETAERVTALLEEREYILGMAGILLARNSSRILGVFVNDHPKYEGHTLDDFFIASSLNFLSAEIERSGQFMMVKKAERAEEIVQFASMWNMDGIVVIGFCEQDYALLRSRMRIPFAVYDGLCRPPQRFLNLTIDNFDGGRQVGQHFRALGHETALCISDNDTGIDRDRMLGFCRGFAPGNAAQLIVPMRNAPPGADHGAAGRRAARRARRGEAARAQRRPPRRDGDPAARFAGGAKQHRAAQRIILHKRGAFILYSVMRLTFASLLPGNYNKEEKREVRYERTKRFL